MLPESTRLVIHRTYARKFPRQDRRGCEKLQACVARPTTKNASHEIRLIGDVETPQPFSAMQPGFLAADEQKPRQLRGQSAMTTYVPRCEPVVLHRWQSSDKTKFFSFLIRNEVGVAGSVLSGSCGTQPSPKHETTRL